MTDSEYQELVQFLGRKFDETDQRFGGMDRRLDQMTTKEEMRAQHAETRRHFDVVAEDLRGQMQILAEGHQALVEGHQALAEGQERILVRMERMERELGAMIRISYAELEQRIQKVEQGMTALQDRMARVEARQS
jgi:polyhydroxyalkanoate synthesis regulator phasin